MRPNSRQTFFLLGALYLAQGLPFGFFTQALPVMMRERGYSLEEISLTSILALPWALKFVWAPLVDRFGNARIGRRKSWILPLQAATVLVVAGAGFLDPSSLGPVLCVIFAVNFLAATQDIATDGLAVDLLRPRANGIQVAGYRVGMVIGGGALLVAFSRIGWTATFAVMAAIIALTSLPVLFTREPEKARETRGARFEAPANGLPHFIRTPGAMGLLLIVMVYKSGDALATAMIRPLLVDMGLGMEEIGSLLGISGFIAGMLGAVVGGALVSRLGRRKSLLVFGVFQAFAVGSYWFVANGTIDPVMLYTITALEHFAGGTATAALFTCMMDWTRPNAAASDYTVLASAVVIATGFASTFSGFLAAAIGYSNHFLLSGALALAAVGMVAVMTEGSGIHIRLRRSA
ncbi:MAG: putative MFS family arabinose efflux permease [Bradymonadia bacterium]|jgi:predicted MFS family arabinose efflux permease